MKILFFLALLSVTACEDKEHVPVKYPGHMSRMTDCYDLWNLHYPVNVQKCEDYLQNPKFKVGQRVRLISNKYDKSCTGIITSNQIWAPGVNEGRYGIDIYCDGKLVRSLRAFDGFVESELK